MYRLLLLQIIISTLLFASCELPHQHRGSSFITSPGLELFGANLSVEKNGTVIKSYFQSSIIGRTEYIYENLDIEITIPVTAGKTYDVPASGIGVRYAAGGQGGQIGTAKAKGSLTVLEVSDSRMKLLCNLEFSGFTMEGQYGKVPDSVTRKGTLTALKGYRLY